MKKWKSSITQILENWKIIIRFFLKYNDKMVIILFLVVILGSLTGLGISYLLSYYINTVIANSSGIHKTVLVIWRGPKHGQTASARQRSDPNKKSRVLWQTRRL